MHRICARDAKNSFEPVATERCGPSAVALLVATIGAGHATLTAFEAA